MATKPEFEQVKYGDDIDAIKWNSNFKEILDYVEAISEELTLKVNTINSQLSSNVLTSLQSVYPIGSIYIGVTDTCPIASLFGTWELVSSGRVLQGAGNGYGAGAIIEAGLPNITGSFSFYGNRGGLQEANGAFYSTRQQDNAVPNMTTPGPGYRTLEAISYQASSSNPIYGRSNTVQPPAYLVNIWKRTA